MPISVSQETVIAICVESKMYMMYILEILQGTANNGIKMLERDPDAVFKNQSSAK